MNDLLLTVLSLSLSGSMAAAVLLLLKPLLRKPLRHGGMYYIWLVVVARLLLPFSPEANLVGGLFRPDPQPAAVQASVQSGALAPGAEIPGRQQPSAAPRYGNDQEAGEEIPPDANPSYRFSWSSLLPWVGALWLAVAACLFLRALVSYARLVGAIRTQSVRCCDREACAALEAACTSLGITRPPQVLVNNLVPAPMLAGFFRQAVVLPGDVLNSGDLDCILRHELIHYKRMDILYKWAVQLALCVHWFNPLLYRVRREINRCCELACDEAVIASVGQPARMRYGEAILSAVKQEKAPGYTGVSISMGEDARMLKERLDAILTYKAGSKATIFLFALLASTLLCGAAYAGSYTAHKQPARSGLPTGAAASESAAGMNTVTVKGATWFLVDTEEQLREIGTTKPSLSRKYLLNADITLDKTVDWVPIGTPDAPFTGTFNGNGHEIIGLTITDPQVSLIGMFGYAERAQIYNVTLRGVDIQSAFRPGDSIAPVLALGSACDTFDNMIVDPVEMRDSGNLTATQTAAGRKDDAQLTDRISEFAPYGLSYDAANDCLYYGGQRVKLFAVYKPDRSFDVCWQDKNGGSLYLEGLTDGNGTAAGVAALDKGEADELLAGLGTADATIVSKVTVPAKYTTFDATFIHGTDEVVATDRGISKTSVPAAVRDWIADCDRADGAYLLRQAADTGYTYYFYYNGGGRYPWLLDVDGSGLLLTLLEDDPKATNDGYHILRIDTKAQYDISASLGDRPLRIREKL